MKNKLWFLLVALGVQLAFIACEETDEVDEYANWSAQNQSFIDSIATVARRNADGTWKTYKAYDLSPDNDDVLTATYDNNNYIYCQVVKAGTGTSSPEVTDSVRVHYRAWFFNGKLMDESFRGDTLNTSISVPPKFSMGSTITGWTTALLYMKEGDTWDVYIPYTLGYGTSGVTGVPGYSALKYRINLVGVYPVGTAVPAWK